MLRIFYDEQNKVATFVATEMSAEEIEVLAQKILHTRIEFVSHLKSNGYVEDDNTPDIPLESATSSDELPFDVNKGKDNEEKDVKGTNVSNVVTTNPIPEDNSGINTSLLAAPIKDAPKTDIKNDTTTVEHTEEDTSEIEEYVFNFGGQKGFKGKSIMDAIIEDPKKAFSYFKWVLENGILKNKTPNEDVFKKDALKQMKIYFTSCEPKEDELNFAAYVLLASSPEEIRNEVLSIFGYADINEFFNSNNSQNFADAIKMIIA